MRFPPPIPGCSEPARVLLETAERVDGAFLTANKTLTGVLSSLHLPSWLFLTSDPCCLKGRGWGQRLGNPGATESKPNP